MKASSATPSTRRTSRGVALSLVAALAAGGPAPARAQEPRPLAVADEPAELALPPGLADDARDLARAGQHAAAAIRFEAAAASTGDLRLTYHAGLARSHAGHHALAWRHFNAVLGRGLADPARQHVQARIAAEQALTVPVRLQLLRGRGGAAVDPSWLGDGQIVVRAAAEPPDAQVMFTQTGYSGQPLYLDPGQWIVQVRLRGHRPAELFGTVIPGAADTTWQVVVAPLQVPVDLRFSPASAVRGAHLRLTSVGEPTPRVIERDLQEAALTMMLPVGTYQLDVTARRREAHTQIVLAPGQGPITIELRKPDRGTSGTRFDRNDTLMAGLGILLLAELTAGLSVSLVGGVVTTRALNRNERLLMAALVDDATGDADGEPGLDHVEATYPTADYHGDLRRGMNFGTAGVALVAGAVGVFVPAMTVQARLRRRVAYIEMGFGAAMLAGGAVWMHGALSRRDRVLEGTDPTDRITGPELRGLTGPSLGAATLTGLGISLLVLPAAAVLADRRYKRRHGSASLSPWSAPGQAGLSLHGRF